MAKDQIDSPELRRRRWIDAARIYGLSIGMSLIFTTFFTMGDRPMIHVSPLVAAFIYGIPYGTVFYSIDRLRLADRKFPSFLVTVGYRTFVFAVGILIAFFLSISTTVMFQGKASPLDPQVYRIAFEVMRMPILIVTYGLSFVIVFAINCTFAVSRKLGPGIIWNWLRGYYHQPREEQRIFMFLDMKDSTALAERLGNLQFSGLVRDFFQDLTMPLIETRGEVSHYIGDEAVLTWRMDRGIANANCLQCFFRMKDAVAKRADFYQQKYGLVPEFKAGIHCGLVVATEVGELKSEIVFHGDVLNTTARIEGLCNSLQSELLASRDVIQLISSPTNLEFERLGSFELKGKENEVEIFRVLSR
jgi:adenylate cyclase